MNASYFENIERHCQVSEKNNGIIIPTRRCIRNISGIEIKKEGVSQIPAGQCKQMAERATKKYVKMTEQITHQIQNGKRKGITKYQTLGWKHAKEIKSWCDENNINCNIVTDQTITRNKLQSIDIWHDEKGYLYDDYFDDYGYMYLNYRSIKQPVVYIQVSK